MKNILASDIGGTSSRFAHFKADGAGGLALEGLTILPTKESPSFAELLDALRGSGFSLMPEDADSVCLAVAGPVRGTYCDPPNIAWDVDISLSASLGLRRAVMINDFVAQAYACLSSVGREAKVVLSGEHDPMGAVAVVGPGTGFGKAALIPDIYGGFHPMASEGGHASFPFVSEEEQKFSEFIIRKLGVDYPSIDNVVTGGGMALLHEFLTGEALEHHEVPTGKDAGEEALRWGARLLARVARNFALDTLSTGGLFIAGGVAARTPALVEHEAFGEEFTSSEKHSALLGQIPVRLITNEESGLWGAAYRGLMELKG